jgi:hypothetical protein
MPHLELIFLHSESADGCNARRVRTADVSTPDAERRSEFMHVDDLAGTCAFLRRPGRRFWPERGRQAPSAVNSLKRLSASATGPA